MGSTLDRKKMVQDAGNNRFGFILAFIFMVWLFWPNNNSFIRLSYWSYNTFYGITKLFNHPIATEAMYYRNCAIYLAKINPKNPEPALKLIQKAITISSNKKTTVELEKFYRERAIIKLYYGDKTGALEDYELANIIEEPIDNLRMAMLLTINDRYEEAIKNCKTILARGKSEQTTLGYVCYAYVYEKIGEPEKALSVYNWIIKRMPRESYLYVERANLEKRTGDINSYNKDINTVQKIDPKIDIEKASVTDSAIDFKTIPLSVK